MSPPGWAASTSIITVAWVQVVSLISMQSQYSYLDKGCYIFTFSSKVQPAVKGLQIIQQ